MRCRISVSVTFSSLKSSADWPKLCRVSRCTEPAAQKTPAFKVTSLPRGPVTAEKLPGASSFRHVSFVVGYFPDLFLCNCSCLIPQVLAFCDSGLFDSGLSVISEKKTKQKCFRHPSHSFLHLPAVSPRICEMSTQVHSAGCARWDIHTWCGFQSMKSRAWPNSQGSPEDFWYLSPFPQALESADRPLQLPATNEMEWRKTFCITVGELACRVAVKAIIRALTELLRLMNENPNESEMSWLNGNVSGNWRWRSTYPKMDGALHLLLHC